MKFHRKPLEINAQCKRMCGTLEFVGDFALRAQFVGNFKENPGKLMLNVKGCERG